MAALDLAFQHAQSYLNAIDDRAVFPNDAALADLDQFREDLPRIGRSADAVIHLLAHLGAPATVATTGRRYFGFVTGGILPVATAANLLMAAWDQNASSYVNSPLAAVLEEVALKWLVQALALPDESDGGLVTGATMANFTALAAARHHLLARQGWDVEAHGLFGAPEIKVIVSEEVHASVLQALMMLGLGKERVYRVPCDTQGRMRPDALPLLDAMSLICLQAGNVNSGAFDPAQAICESARAAGAWVHVDGAFGLWARATQDYHHLTQGYDLADSWALDGHKWLNVSYDNGIVLCRHRDALQQAMTVNAPYFVTGDQREPNHYTPEQSRRTRGIEVWAALKYLGREGLSQMIERDCQLAAYFADSLRSAGFEVLNDVVINQVLVTFGDDTQTRRVIAALQAEGTLWAGPSVWHGRTAMRFSISSWKTTHTDIDQCLATIVRIAQSTH